MTSVSADRGRITARVPIQVRETLETAANIVGATVTTLRAKAFDLSESDRAELAHDLPASLDGPSDPAVAQAWEAEILRRLDQLDNGTAKLIDREELRRRMYTRMAGT